MLYQFRHFVAFDGRRLVVLTLDRLDYEAACARVAPGYFDGVRGVEPDTAGLELVRVTVSVPAAVKLVDALGITGAAQGGRQLADALDGMAAEVAREPKMARTAARARVFAAAGGF